ncbi:MAG: MarR family transcriptional regulator [Burkholderiaceae bacterium]
MDSDLPIAVTHEVRDRCLCLHTQRAARRLAKRFDDALRPLGLTNGQFSLLMALNRPQAPRIGDLAELLAMDRTTLSAALKPLQRRRLLVAEADADDARVRRLRLTRQGIALLKLALPVWRESHAGLDQSLGASRTHRLRADLDRLG